MYQAPRHRVFVSYHHEDQSYKDSFVAMMGNDIVDESVGDGDIEDRILATETIRQRIRDNFIRDATAAVVLIGPYTWQRKHVDWEIGSSLRATRNNSRCGLLGILLPITQTMGDSITTRALYHPDWKLTVAGKILTPRFTIGQGILEPTT